MNASSGSVQVLERVDSGLYKNSEEVVVEYLKALVKSEKLSEFAKEAGPAEAEDHRSVRRLLKDLQVKTHVTTRATAMLCVAFVWRQEVRVSSGRQYQNTSSHLH